MKSDARSEYPRRFFFLFSLLLLLTVFVGFAPSFYLRDFFPPPPGVPRLPATPAYVYIHGVLMTMWYLLFAVQSGLVAQGRRQLHRALGTAGAILTVAIVPLGWFTLNRSAPRFALLTGLTPDQLTGLDSGLMRGMLGLVLFAVCVAVALLRRKDAATHGRLMLLAGVAASGAALAPTRMLGALAQAWLPPWLLAESVFVAAGVLVLACYDLRTLRRIHPATMIVGPMLLLLVPAAQFIAASEAGHAWFLGLFK